MARCWRLLPRTVETPTHLGTEAFGLLGVLADNRDALGRRDVVTRNPIVVRFNAETFSEIFLVPGQAVAATHDEEEYS
jgi:hypothetical protein